MSVRIAVGFALVAGYVGFVAHTAASTQCPLREVGPCARVHALLLGPPRPERALTTIALPMRARDVAVVPLRVASAATRVTGRP